jgi:dinuclear metal center YbgI/SA1388 family protein
MMAKTVADIIEMLDLIAPARLAEQWDNTGLQVGRRNWTVRTIRVALDPLPEVVDAACSDNVDLLITHHPLIFHPVKSIDIDTPLGSILETAIRHRLAILCAHTNLDTVTDGINDVLARRMGLKNLKVLGESKQSEIFTLVLYLPTLLKDKFRKIIDDINPADNGCGRGQDFFSPAAEIVEPDRPGDLVQKTGGRHPDDRPIRLETSVQKKNVTKLLQAFKKICPEDVCTYHLYPRISIGKRQGLGRVGDLEKGMDLNRFAQLVKRRLGLKSIRVCGDPETAVYKAAVCSGSGSSLLGTFFSTNAQVYVTGDLRYHDAREAEALNRGLIDIGHYPSEHIIKEVLVERLRTCILKAGEEIRVEACRLEKDPFMII